MSVNAQVHLSSNENNKKSDKTLKQLFPKRDECSHVSCYCEENVWKLCQDVSLRIPEELDRCFIVFISNPCRTVPLWKQRAGREEDRLVIWDYHVIFLYSWDNKTCLVYDLDSELPFPTFFHKYVTETFRTDQVLKSDFHRFFRVVPAKQFLQSFASDRRHMKRPDGSWIKPPPPYPAICTSTSTHNLDEYINMDFGVGPGIGTDLERLAKEWGSLPTLSPSAQDRRYLYYKFNYHNAVKILESWCHNADVMINEEKTCYYLVNSLFPYLLFD